MVYEWEPHREVLSRLYVDERKQIEDIVEYMRTNHNFAPSKRAYQAQFKRWKFPSKHQPALKNDQLVARVRELWERNLSQAEMLRVLNDEDGYSIKRRELNRVRSTHRWLLRVPSDKKRGSTESASDMRDEDLTEGDVLHDAGLLTGEDDSAQSTPGVSELASHLMEERKRRMEAESRERWATKKRRRRTRQYAGMPADPPGPPRFPSETTLAESQVILGLARAEYNAVREKFQSICEAAGIMKKTISGPEAWDAAKQSLVGEFLHLQHVIWIDRENSENKKLALDVICSDVTKRMRSGGDKPLLLADAKNILGLNPLESRETRIAFYKILKADGFTSKVAMGVERLKELKQKWIDESEMLQRILARLDDTQSHEMKIKAVEALATDVMKRLRDNQSRHNGGKREESKSSADGVENMEVEDEPSCIGAMEDDGPDFATDMLVAPGPNNGHHGPSHPPRMMPDHHLVDPQMGMQVPMDPQLGPELLLDPNSQGAFVDPRQQFLQAAAPIPAPPPPYDPSQPAAPPDIFQTPAATNPTAIPIYLRLFGHNVNQEGALDIAVLTSQSIEEVRQIAEQKIPGSRCVHVEGLLKVPTIPGQYVPIQIQDNNQLGAYLAQEGPPTFNVQLAF